MKRAADLWSELHLINVWEHDYRLRNHHDAIDRFAHESRRQRLKEIRKELDAIGNPRLIKRTDANARRTRN